MKSRQSTVEWVVVGGGPAGAMAGLRLAHAGREVRLVEREGAAHDKVCGEFLSAEAIAYLRAAGIDPVALGAAPIDYLRFSTGDRVAECALPFPALSLSRRVLDEALLARAAQGGCEVIRGAAVEKLAREGDAWIARLDSHSGDECVVSAKHAMLATGKHDLRGWQRGAGAQNHLVAFKLHWRLAPAQTEALRGAMEMFLLGGGYGGLALVEGDAANLCLVVLRATLRALGGWAEVLEHLRAGNGRMRERLDGAKALWERPLAISAIPYGYLARGASGLWRVGDQAAVIPSFTGDGMSIALHSGALAAEMFLAGKTADEHCAELRAQLRGSMRLAMGISRTLVTRMGKRVAPVAVGLAPRAMRWIATATRIPATAMLSACLESRQT